MQTFTRAGSPDGYTFAWGARKPSITEYKQAIIIGSVSDLESVSAPGGPLASLLPADFGWAIAALAAGAPGSSDEPTTSSVIVPGGAQICFGRLPTAVSRHNSPALPYAILSAIKATAGASGSILLAVFVPSASYAATVAFAVGASFPVFSNKTGKRGDANIDVVVIPRDGSSPDYSTLSTIAANVRFTAGLIDAPTSHINTDEMVAVACEVAEETGSRITVLQRDTLPAAFGGLWGVGKAAEHPPALVVLEYTPSEPGPTAQHIVLAGKGIVYDTGGLSLKGSDAMPGMKTDMGGSAGVLGAFRAIAQSKTARNKVTAILCLAENSVGPASTRPDDIITLYSGKTVEVNNTDAEGRLVLGDGVAYAVKHLSPTIIIDMATLTGAQGIATGRRHAGVYCNNDALEKAVIATGKLTGNMVQPLLYCPEFHAKEFASSVADMKNHISAPFPAGSSCAGQFIAAHTLGFVDTGLFCHIDMAFPVKDGDRATGWGVPLLFQLCNQL